MLCIWTCPCFSWGRGFGKYSQYLALSSVFLFFYKTQQQLNLKWELESCFSTSRCSCMCVLCIAGNASYALTTQTNSSDFGGLSWGRKKSFLLCRYKDLVSSYVRALPGADFRNNSVNFDCRAHVKVQVCGLLILSSTSRAWSCRNTGQGSTWVSADVLAGSLHTSIIKGVWTV